MTTQKWTKWSDEVPPTDGAFKTSRGWEFTHPNGQTEILVAMGTVDPTGAGDIANISSITTPKKKTHILGDTLTFVVNYNEPVDVTGTPQLSITFESGTVTADYVSGTGTNALTFEYTVVADDIDLNGIVINDNVALNAGAIVDANTSDNAELTFTGSDFADTRIKVDAVVRTLDSVTAPAGNVATDGTIDITVAYNQPVIVSGTPRIPVFENDGTTALEGEHAFYVSGTGTTDLLFRYTVLSTDSEAVAVKAGANIDLNGGTITDTSKKVDATILFAQTTLTGVTLNQ